MATDAPPEVPPQQWTPWRVRSRTCAGIDTVVLCVGVVLLVVPLLDSILSWPGNWVLVSASRLGTITAILLVPTWLWVLASMYFVRGAVKPPRDNWYKTVWKSPTVRAFLGVALLLLAVFLIDAAIGMANGSLRVLPNGVHQVSTGSVDHSAWTTVSDAQYRVWGARFVREDALIAIVAVAMIGLSLSFLRLHRATAPAE